MAIPSERIPTAGGRHHAPRRDPGSPSTEAIEDYAKAIFALERRAGAPVSNSALAERLEVSPASVSAMLKRMAELGLVKHEPYHGVALTAAGELIALEVLRHHRLIESYLTEALGMPWDRVHAEAEVLEHHISEELEERIAEALGNPSFDPHGDPIPGPDLVLERSHGIPLSDLEPGAVATLSRVSDADPAMLRFLDEHSIRPGIELRVAERDPLGDSLLVETPSGPHAIGARLARRMIVSLD